MESISVIVARFPLEKYLFKAPEKPDPLERLERLLNKGTVVPAEPIEVAREISTPQPGVTRPQEIQKRQYGAGCQPCTADHLATCAGALAEAIRFARTDGMGSIEVQERLALCAEEMNIWERRDAAPKSFVSLPPEDKEFLRRWLPKGRSFRHRVNQIVSLEDLEGVAAEAQKLHLELRKEIREKARPALGEG